MNLSAFVCVSEELYILGWLGFCWVFVVSQLLINGTTLLHKQVQI